MTTDATTNTTIVVGAGPVGVTAALALRARGHSVTLVEAEPEDRLRPGSRAIFTHRASLESLEAVWPGLGRRIAGHGITWPVKRTLWRGREAYVRHYPPPRPDRLPPFTSLAQVRTEQMMVEAAKESGVEFVWGVRIADVRADRTGVTLQAEDGRRFRAGYVVAADGARSAVRSAIGAAMTGSRSANSYIVVDLEEDPSAPMPLERVFHYEHPAIGRRNVLFVPFAGGLRVDLQCDDDDDVARFSGVEGVRRWLPRVLPARYADRVAWVSTYQFLQLVAASFVDAEHRVLLVGEAAHLFAPFGARGMNSGISDAMAAAEAVDRALRAEGGAPAREAIAAFDAVRRAAAEHNRAAAGAALQHIQARDLSMRVRRWSAGTLARFSSRAGRWLDEGPYGPKTAPAGSAKY